jgi:hypothetical protein
MSSPKKMSLMLFDDIFFIFDKSEDTIVSKSVLEFDQFVRENSLAELEFYQDLPYVLIPEIMYQEGEHQFLINQKYPHLLPAYSYIKADTWPMHFIKCVYYVPKVLVNHREQVFHLYTAFSKWSEVFFEKHSYGLWAFKLQNKMMVFLRINNGLKEGKSFEIRSPDEAGFHLLKMLEPYKEYQHDMTLWTNESDPYHLQIMSKYIPAIKVEKNDVKFLIKNILATTCVSLQEI